MNYVQSVPGKRKSTYLATHYHLLVHIMHQVRVMIRYLLWSHAQSPIWIFIKQKAIIVSDNDSFLLNEDPDSAGQGSHQARKERQQKHGEKFAQSSYLL